VDTGRIDRVVSPTDPQEAGTLFECLGAQARNLQQSFAVAERSRVVPVGDDRLEQGF